MLRHLLIITLLCWQALAADHIMPQSNDLITHDEKVNEIFADLLVELDTIKPEDNTAVPLGHVKAKVQTDLKDALQTSDKLQFEANRIITLLDLLQTSDYQQKMVHMEQTPVLAANEFSIIHTVLFAMQENQLLAQLGRNQQLPELNRIALNEQFLTHTALLASMIKGLPDDIKFLNDSDYLTLLNIREKYQKIQGLDLLSAVSATTYFRTLFSLSSDLLTSLQILENGRFNFDTLLGMLQANAEASEVANSALSTLIKRMAITLETESIQLNALSVLQEHLNTNAQPQ
jgi:hypothetical protein